MTRTTDGRRLRLRAFTTTCLAVGIVWTTVPAAGQNCPAVNQEPVPPVVGFSEDEARMRVRGDPGFFRFEVVRDPVPIPCYFWDVCGRVAKQDPPPNSCFGRRFGVVRVWLYDELFTPPSVVDRLSFRAKARLDHRRFPIGQQLDLGPLRPEELAAEPELLNDVRTEDPGRRNRVAVQRPDPRMTPRIRLDETIRLIPYDHVGPPVFGDSTVPECLPSK